MDPSECNKRRRLRGKQPDVRRHPGLMRLFAVRDLCCLMTSWLDERSLLRLSTTSNTSREAAADPEAWSGRRLMLRSRSLKNSQQLMKLLAAFADRWAGVCEVTLPQLQPSAAACRAFCGAFRGVRSLDLTLCPRAGGLRLLAELGTQSRLERLVLPTYLPVAPLPQVKVLELTKPDCNLHLDGAEEWQRLPDVVPNLEVLRAPWLDAGKDADLSEDLKDILGCHTSDECLRHLARLPQLRELDLSGVYSFTDQSLRTLGGLPMLERLTLQSLGSGITGEGLRWLADGVAPLRYLDLSLCMDDGRRPTSGRTALTESDIAAFKRRRPHAQVVFS